MKAHVKINISIHFDEEPFGLAVHHAGVLPVADKAEAERVIEMLGNHVNSTFKQMSVQPVSGTHVPNLAAAMGGEACPHCKGPAGTHRVDCPTWEVAGS